MRGDDIEKIYKGSHKFVEKVKKSQLKKEEDINFIFKIISENPNIYVTELIRLSGKCSEIINRYVKVLVKTGRVTKTKCYSKDVPYKVCLRAS